MNAQVLPGLYQEDLYSFHTGVLVIVSKTWQSYSDEEQTLLRKILASVKVDINATQIISQPVADLKAVLAYSPTRILIFGSASNDNLPLYQAASAQGFMVIRADDLNELDDQKKKNLWLALRQAFGV